MEVNEKTLIKVILKLLSFMNSKQLKKVEDWLNEVDLKLEDFKLNRRK